MASTLLYGYEPQAVAILLILLGLITIGDCPIRHGCMLPSYMHGASQWKGRLWSNLQHHGRGEHRQRTQFVQIYHGENHAEESTIQLHECPSSQRPVPGIPILQQQWVQRCLHTKRHLSMEIRVWLWPPATAGYTLLCQMLAADCSSGREGLPLQGDLSSCQHDQNKLMWSATEQHAGMGVGEDKKHTSRLRCHRWPIIMAGDHHNGQCMIMATCISKVQQYNHTTWI